MLFVMDTTPETTRGVHRLTISAEATAAAWKAAAAALKLDLERIRIDAQFSADFTLDVLAVDPGPDAASFYLVGSVVGWFGMAQIRPSTSPVEVEHIGRLLSAHGAHMESACLASRVCNRLRDPTTPPPAWIECASSLASTVTPSEGLSSCQIEGLIEILSGIKRAFEWELHSGIPSAGATWDGQRAHLHQRIHCERLVPALVAWCSAWWVDDVRLVLE